MHWPQNYLHDFENKTPLYRLENTKTHWLVFVTLQTTSSFCCYNSRLYMHACWGQPPPPQWWGLLLVWNLTCQLAWLASEPHRSAARPWHSSSNTPTLGHFNLGAGNQTRVVGLPSQALCLLSCLSSSRHTFWNDPRIHWLLWDLCLIQIFVG